MEGGKMEGKKATASKVGQNKNKTLILNIVTYNIVSLTWDGSPFFILFSLRVFVFAFIWKLTLGYFFLLKRGTRFFSGLLRLRVKKKTNPIFFSL